MNRKILRGAAVLISVCMLAGCGVKMTNQSLVKTLQNDSDYSSIDSDTVKLISEEDLGSGKSALLFSGKDNEGSEEVYYIGVMNGKTDDISPLKITYSPLALLHKEFLENRPQNVNMSYFKKIVSSLHYDGEACFENDKISAEFLKDITGDNGLISTSTARDIVEKMAKEELGLEDAEDFCAIFEDGSANPVCYASSNSNPADEEKKLWIAYDLDGKNLGMFNSKAELYEQFTGIAMEFSEDEEAEEVVKALTFATAAGNPPFSYMVDDQLAGSEIELARAIANELNMELEIFTTTKEDAVSGTENGTYHMSMGAYTPSSSNGNVSYSDSYQDNYAIMLSNLHSELGNDICVALNNLKADGTIAGIIQKYSNIKVDDADKTDAGAKNPSVSSSAPNTSGSSDARAQEGAYVVRKGANEKVSQRGAFAGLAAARREADKHKDEGYKVYDTNGNLVYAP